MSKSSSAVAWIANGSVRSKAPELLLQEVRSGVCPLIVDVRDEDELRACGAIAGARWLPLHQLGRRLEELSGHQSAPVVVVSQRGNVSRNAAVMLSASGFAEVLTLEGGMSRWIELGYPIESRRRESHA